MVYSTSTKFYNQLGGEFFQLGLYNVQQFMLHFNFEHPVFLFLRHVVQPFSLLNLPTRRHIYLYGAREGTTGRQLLNLTTSGLNARRKVSLCKLASNPGIFVTCYVPQSARHWFQGYRTCSKAICCRALLPTTTMSSSFTHAKLRSNICLHFGLCVGKNLRSKIIRILRSRP